MAKKTIHEQEVYIKNLVRYAFYTAPHVNFRKIVRYIYFDFKIKENRT